MVRNRIFVQLFGASFVLRNWLIGFIYNFVDVLAFEVLVESIFDLRYGSAEERFHFRDLGPLGADLTVHLDDEFVLFARPLSPDDAGVENVVPPFAALATEPSR